MCSDETAEEEPFALLSPSEQERRRELSAENAHSGLARVIELARSGREEADVPLADPLDGGSKASLLVILETPGPQAFRTGFVSRENPDPTAHNLSCLLRLAGIARQRTLIWNVIPYVLRDEATRFRSPRPHEVEDAKPLFLALLEECAAVEAVALLGRHAHRAEEWVSGGVKVVKASHPSSRVFAAWPDKWAHALKELRSAVPR